MAYQRAHSLPNESRHRRAERSVRNRRDKRALVEKGLAHGILVYADGEPVGWCQYGPQDELPRIDTSRKYRELAPKDGTERLWRITCFAVDTKYRRCGVASVGLKAALVSIKKRGGGLVEAYPIINWKPGTFGNVSTHGTISMFKKEGFKIVAPLGSTKFQTNVLVRRTV